MSEILALTLCSPFFVPRIRGQNCLIHSFDIALIRMIMETLVLDNNDEVCINFSKEFDTDSLDKIKKFLGRYNCYSINKLYTQKYNYDDIIIKRSILNSVCRADGGNEHIIEYLINNRADINSLEIYNSPHMSRYCPFINYCKSASSDYRYFNEDLAELFIKSGVDIDGILNDLIFVLENSGRSLYFITDIIELHIKHNFHKLNIIDETPLTYIIYKYGHILNKCELSLSVYSFCLFDSFITKKNARGELPLEIATQHNYHNILSFLNLKLDEIDKEADKEIDKKADIDDLLKKTKVRDLLENLDENFTKITRCNDEKYINLIKIRNLINEIEEICPEKFTK